MPPIVTVDSLGALGDGIARLDGKPLFIPKSCAGDTVEVRIVHSNHDGQTGLIAKLIAPGPERQAAPCRHYAACGGCTLQHLLPGSYRAFKRRMLHQALERAGYPRPEADIAFLPAHTRRRVEFKARHSGGAVALSFHDLRSHDATPIEECLVLNPALQSLIAPLGTALSGHEFSPHLYAASLTAADSGIDLLLTFKGYDLEKLPPLGAMAQQLAIARICARLHGQPSTPLLQRAPVEMRLGDYDVALPAEAFLQATREGQMELTRIALEAVAGSHNVVDLFCGIGSYSFPASRIACVHAVEGERAMASALGASARRHGIKNLTAEARDLFKNPLTVRELSRFDAAIVNPPRAGAKAQTEQLAQSRINTIAMISCNPATFSRDASRLREAGFLMQSACGIDQFLWSAHLEIAAVFKR